MAAVRVKVDTAMAVIMKKKKRQMTKAEEFNDVSETSYKDKKVYDVVLEQIRSRAEHGHNTFRFEDSEFLSNFGISVYESLVSDLKADGFRIYRDPINNITKSVVMW